MPNFKTPVSVLVFNSTDNLSSYNAGTFARVAGCGYLAWVSGSRFNADPAHPDTPSGWTLVESEGPVQHVSDANNRFAGRLFSMVAASSDGADASLGAIGFGGQTMSGCLVLVSQHELDVAGALDIADFVRQAKGIDDASTSNVTHGATLPGAAGSVDNAIYWVDQLAAFANNNGTPKTGFTELQDAVYSGPDTRAAVSYSLDADDLSPTHTWSHANRHMGVVVELQPTQISGGGGAARRRRYYEMFAP